MNLNVSNETPDADREPILVDLKQAARLLAVSQRTAWNLIAAQALPVVRIGRSVRVPIAGLRQFVKDRTRERGDLR